MLGEATANKFAFCYSGVDEPVTTIIKGTGTEYERNNNLFPANFSPHVQNTTSAPSAEPQKVLPMKSTSMVRSKCRGGVILARGFFPSLNKVWATRMRVKLH